MESGASGNNAQGKGRSPAEFDDAIDRLPLGRNAFWAEATDQQGSRFVSGEYIQGQRPGTLTGDQAGQTVAAGHYGDTTRATGQQRSYRLRATYQRTHGVRWFHGCCSLSEDRLWGITHEHKGGRTLTALRSIRAARPDGAPICVILDNLSADTTPAIRSWCRRHKVELCLTPANASWADPIEAQFGPLGQFTVANSDHLNHPAQNRQLQAYLRWRNANNRHPDVIAAQRRERARIRSQRHQRWGRPRPQAAYQPGASPH